MTQDQQPRPHGERHEFSEESESLFRITFTPVIWAVHFVLCYGLVSVACAKGLIAIAPTRMWLIAISVAALAAIGWLGWRSLQQWGALDRHHPRDDESKPEDRHRFLGHAAFLLSIISFIGVVFVSLPLLMIEGCQ